MRLPERPWYTCFVINIVKVEGHVSLFGFGFTKLTCFSPVAIVLLGGEVILSQAYPFCKY